jgi:hypothetical protein
MHIYIVLFLFIYLFIYLFSHLKWVLKQTVAPLFANYDTKNKCVNYSNRLHVPVQNVPGIRWYNLQDLMHEGYFCTWIFFVALCMQSVGIPPNNGEKSVGLSITKMLQHTGRFCLNISWQRTMLQHSSIRHIILTWPQLNFICSLEWNQYCSGGSFVKLLISLRIWRKNWKGFHNMVSSNFFNNFTEGSKSLYL